MSTLSMTAKAENARPTSARVWLSAIRPATLTAALGPVMVGTALAARYGRIDALIVACALLGAIFIQIGTNLYNDYADAKRGADNEERLGPARATQKGWLSDRQVLAATVASFGAAMVCGGYLVAQGGWPILVLGLVSIAAGVLYTGGPFPLAYHGLGDLFVMVFFGGAAVCGSFYLQTHELSTTVGLCAIAVGALATAILVVNNLRDRTTDRAARKMTLVARYGERFGRVEYTLLLLVAYTLPVIICLSTPSYGLGVLTPLLTSPLALWRVRQAWRLDGAQLNPLLGATAQLGLLYCVSLSAGVLL